MYYLYSGWGYSKHCDTHTARQTCTSAEIAEQNSTETLASAPSVSHTRSLITNFDRFSQAIQEKYGVFDRLAVTCSFLFAAGQ